jgi:hypothetical protein
MPGIGVSALKPYHIDDESAAHVLVKAGHYTITGEKIRHCRTVEGAGLKDRFAAQPDNRDLAGFVALIEIIDKPSCHPNDVGS